MVRTPRVRNSGSRALMMTGLGILLGVTPISTLADVVLNEVVYDPAALGRDDATLDAVRIELYNAGPADVPLTDWTIGDRDGLPSIALPSWTLPAGGFLTVYLTSGTDDPNFDDAAGSYYAGDPGPLFDPWQDECALYSGPPDVATIIDFVAWSADGAYAPGVAHGHAIGAGQWSSGAYVDTQDLATGASLARYFDGHDRNLPVDWQIVPIETYVHRRAHWVENPIQLEPRNRAVLDVAQPTFAWNVVPDAAHYAIQVDNDYLFGSPLIDVTGLSAAQYTPGAPLAGDAYFWRVRAYVDGAYTPWSAGWLFVVEDGMRVVEQQVCRSCPFKFQRKDTNLLCLWDDTSDDTRPGCPETGDCGWDKPHPAAGPDDSGCMHGHNYCWAASIAMVNAKYGGDLSQDRISYENWTAIRPLQPEPEDDLGHNRTNNDPAITQCLSWALNGAGITYYKRGVGGFTFAELQNWISTRDCFVAAIPGHCLVIEGYAQLTASNGTNIQVVYSNDPWISSGYPHVFSYVIGGAAKKYKRQHDKNNFDAVWLQPTSGVTGRTQEASVTTDTDGDGVMDFDEDVRALECLSTDDDTDDDEVLDKDEIRNYTFHDSYHAGHDNDSLQFSDIDLDGHRSENDCDSDDDGDFDGGEDVNGNGHNPDKAWETCMFDLTDFEIGVSVDKDVYLVGEPVYLIDTRSRKSRSFHEWSVYWYELGIGCPIKSDGDPVGHSNIFFTNGRGRAQKHLVHYCPSANDYYLYVDVLSDNLYSVPDNWDPPTCWTCINGLKPVPSKPSTPTTPGCPTYPTPITSTGTNDPDGVITRWQWKINNEVWADGNYPQTEAALPPGVSTVTLTVWDNDGLSESASEDFVNTGGLPLPATLTLDQQITTYQDPADERYHAITAEWPAMISFMADGTGPFTRVEVPTGSWWVGPVIDLPMACYQPVDLNATPNLELSCVARFYQGTEYPEPYANASIHAAVRDRMGNWAELGVIYAPEDGPQYPEWQPVSLPIVPTAVDDEFDPTQVTQIVFHGPAPYSDMPEPMYGWAWVDIRDVYFGPGEPPPGDCTGEGEVTFDDFEIFGPCLLGPWVPPAPGCECGDADGDIDADIADVALFQTAFGI